MKSVSINAKITAIPDDCFKECTGLKSISFGEDVTTIEAIGSSAFYGCTQLGSITIPNSVTIINAYAFQECSGMTEVSIPASVKAIGSNAFKDCSSLQNVKFASIQQLCSIDFKNKSANPLSGADPKKVDAHHLYIINETSGEEVEVKEINLTGITTIGQYAFSECWGLTSIYIPADVTTIGTDAFDFEKGKDANKPFPKTTFASIESLCMTDFVTKKSNPIYYQNHVYTSEQTNRFTTVNIPSTSLKTDGKNGKKFLRANIFANASIVTVSIPEYTDSIAPDAFYECNSLMVANYPHLNYVNGISYANQYSNPLSYASVLKVEDIDQSELTINYNVKEKEFIKQRWLKKVIFQDGVTSIGDQAFDHCENLTTVVFDEGINLKTIGVGAFWGCTNLTSVTLPESLQSLGKEAFRYCRGIKNITIPAACGTLGTLVFDNCSGLTKVEVNSSVDIIPNGFFSGCDHLKEVTWPAVETIGPSAFRNCSSLTVFPKFDNLATIQKNAFELCSGLTNLVLPNNVVYIGESAFASCSRITSLSIPNPEGDRIDILSNAFDKCTSLTEVYSFIVNPTINTINVSSDAFGDRASSITLFVPIGSKDLFYAKKEPWKSFNSIYEMSGNQVTLSFYVNDELQENMKITKQPGLAIEADINKIEDKLAELLKVNDDNEKNEFSGWDQKIPKTMPNEDMNFYGYISYVREIEGFKWHLYPAETHPAAKESKAVLISITEELANDDKTFRNGIEVPSKVTYNSDEYPVKVIASRAFNANDIKGCNKIPKVKLHEDLEMIESAAFDGCSAIKQVFNFPDKLTVISDYLFYGCTSLEEIQVGDEINSLPNSITKIGDEAFRNCRYFDLKTLPTSLERIGSQAFYGSGISSVSFQKELTLDKEIFKECKNLKTADFAADYKLAVPQETFSGCTNLENVTLHAVNNIDLQAFMGCTALTNITIPETVSFIGNYAFNGCKNLQQIKVENSDPKSITAQDSIFSKSTYENATLYVPSGKTAAYTNVKYIWHNFKHMIESGDFELYYELDGTVIDSLKVNAGAAVVPAADPEEKYNKEGRKFSGWKNQPTVMPNENVTVKGGLEYKVTYYKDNVDEANMKADSAFFYDDNIVIPVKKLSVKESKFTITFKDFKKKDGEEVVYEDLIVTQDEVANAELKMPAKDITAIVTYAQSEADTVINDITYRIVDMNTNNPHAELIDGSKATGEFTIPSSINYDVNNVNYRVTAIGDRAFRSNKNLVIIKHFDNIEKMGSNIFEYCYKLQKCYLSSAKITSLPNNTFSSCNSLDDVTLPSALDSIGDQAFMNCNKLAIIELPSKLKSIGESAFSGCVSLKNITLGSELTSIGKSAFFNALGEGGTLTINKDVELPSAPSVDENAFDETTYTSTTLKTKLWEKVKDYSPWNLFVNVEVDDASGTSLLRCPKPSIIYDNENKKLVFRCDEQGATIVYNIVVHDQQKGSVTSEDVPLTRIYEVTAYARVDGKLRSEDAVEEFQWYSKGDVNDDGFVTVTDAVEVIKICTGNTGEITPVQTPNE